MIKITKQMTRTGMAAQLGICMHTFRKRFNNLLDDDFLSKAKGRNIFWENESRYILESFGVDPKSIVVVNNPVKEKKEKEKGKLC